MNEASQWTTRQSLLVRAMDPEDKTAWSDFSRYYERFIFHLLHRMSVDSSDCSDLAQDIQVKLWKSLHTYDSKKASFRTWLARVVRNAVWDYFSARNRRLNIERQLAEDYLLEESNTNELEQLIEEEWIAYVTEIAIERVRKLYSGDAVEVFLLGMKDVPVEEIARRLNLTRDSVYTLRSRVKASFLTVLRQLREELEPGFQAETGGA